MTADVTPLVRVPSGCTEEGSGKRELITRDLLGGGGAAPSVGEVDLNHQSPVEWARSLDLLSGRRRSGGSIPPAHREMQDLNLPPAAAEVELSLDPPAFPTAAVYQSVCTIEKVKSALERESRGKRPRPAASSPSPSSSTTSSSADGTELSSGGGGGGGMMAAGCPRCLLYVLICRSDPRCPKCDSHVPVPKLNKRPRFDLNFA